MADKKEQTPEQRLDALEKRVGSLEYQLQETHTWLASYGIQKPAAAAADASKPEPPAPLIEHPDGVKYIPFTPLAAQKDGTALPTSPKPTEAEEQHRELHKLIAANPDLATVKVPDLLAAHPDLGKTKDVA